MSSRCLEWRRAESVCVAGSAGGARAGGELQRPDSAGIPDGVYYTGM